MSKSTLRHAIAKRVASPLRAVEPRPAYAPPNEEQLARFAWAASGMAEKGFPLSMAELFMRNNPELRGAWLRRHRELHEYVWRDVARAGEEAR